MRILEPTPAEAAAGIRAVAMVARAPGEIATAARNMIAAARLGVPAKHEHGAGDYD